MTSGSEHVRTAEIPPIPAPLPQTEGHDTFQRAYRWFSWIFGLAMLVAVIIAAAHFSEERAIVRLTEKARPWWLAVAIVLQVGTYLAQGESWRVVTRAATVSVPVWVVFKLSLAKIFIDQALPSGGISGTVVVARVLERRGILRSIVMAVVVVDTVASYATYVLALTIAMFITAVYGHASRLILVAAFCFALFSALVIVAALALSGRKIVRPSLLRRVPLLQRVLALIGQADPKFARSPFLLFQSGMFQLVIVLLDTATVWVLIRSLGVTAAPARVFASFMVSALLRTISIVPGGLGVFEAASVLTLRIAGVPIAVALAATLLFRGLSFWLPMVPGLVFSRGARDDDHMAVAAPTSAGRLTTS